MRIIDRLLQYLHQKNISAHSFERNCGIANGYLKKQMKGKGTIGSEILEKILDAYPDISLNWLVTGQGAMTDDSPTLQEDPQPYTTPGQVIELLNKKVAILEQALADKEKIIRLLEEKLR